MSIGAGCFYTVVLNHDGTLFASGFNINGCLAQGTRAHERRFLSVSAKCDKSRKRGPGSISFRKIGAGMQHWLAVDDDGGVWACGSNYYGQLGIAGSEALCMRPVKGFGGERVASIACGLAHSLVSTAGGLLFAAGCNSHGQLGVGDFANRAEFVAVCEPASGPPCRVAAAAGSLAAGGWHSACVDAEGCVRAWGSVIGTQPVFGSDAQWCRAQIPVPSRFHPETFGGERVLMVSAGHCHAVAVTLGSVFSWGDGIKGCLGHGDWQSLPLPKAIAAFAAEPGAPEGARPGLLKSVACGPYHNIAIHASGGAYVWGDNGKGQLGLGDRVTRCLPTRVAASCVDGQPLMEVCAGTQHCGAITEGGLLYTWGRCRAGGLRGLKLPCGLGVAHKQGLVPFPCRVTALFDTSPGARGGSACLGRWHGICTQHALAWLMGRHPRLGGGLAPPRACGARRSRRIAAQSRVCWVAALPEDIVELVLDQCRGGHGWFSHAI